MELIIKMYLNMSARDSRMMHPIAYFKYKHGNVRAGIDFLFQVIDVYTYHSVSTYA